MDLSMHEHAIRWVEAGGALGDPGALQVPEPLFVAERAVSA